MTMPPEDMVALELRGHFQRCQCMWPQRNQDRVL
jgi:hypothetical protein